MPESAGVYRTDTFGFREFSPEKMQQSWNSAWERWQVLRTEAHSRFLQR